MINNKYPVLKGLVIFWLLVLFTTIPFQNPHENKYYCLPSIVCEPQEGWCDILEKIAIQYLNPNYVYMGKCNLLLGKECAVISTEPVYSGYSETYLWFEDDELTVWELNKPALPEIVLRLPYSLPADEMYKQLSKYLSSVQRNKLMIFAEPAVPVCQYFQQLSQLSRHFNGCLYIHGPYKLEAYKGPIETIYWAPAPPDIPDLPDYSPCID